MHMCFGRAIAPRLPSTTFLISASKRRAQFGRGDPCRILDHGEGDRLLALQLVVDADHGDFGHRAVSLHGFLDLTRAKAVAGDVDDVIGTSEDEVIALVVRMPQSNDE
jgi:hypothetical protein